MTTRTKSDGTSFWDKVMGFFHRIPLVAKKIIGWPLVGEFEGRFIVDPPKLATEEFGQASKSPGLLEIYVSSEKQWPLDIGRTVNDRYFPDDPPIVFNVCFCCAKPTLLRGGDYANPESHWFNVFFGFYEIDVPVSRWDHPFGFEAFGSENLRFDELERIGKSDWNYFSNHVYGVPLAVCDRYKDISDRVKTWQNPAPVVIGDKRFTEGMVEDMEVVSGYVSGKDGQKLGYPCGIFSPLWRTVFGRPRRSPLFPTSFVPTRMKMRFLTRHTKGPDEDLGEEAYKTFIYGGTANITQHEWALTHQSSPVDMDRFLAAQMDAVTRCIREDREFRKEARPARPAEWKKQLF